MLTLVKSEQLEGINSLDMNYVPKINHQDE